MRFTLCINLLIIVAVCKAQRQEYTAFTEKDGLPSNYLYRCVEDNSGFLWVATDAGIARFDGKHFQTFTTKQGLPDNEVLDVVKEKNGRIWVNCFRQWPAYFDEVQNRFRSPDIDSNMLVAKQGTAIGYLYALPNGGVVYRNENGNMIYRNCRLDTSAINTELPDFLIKENSDTSVVTYGGFKTSKPFVGNGARLYQIKNSERVDSVFLRIYSNDGQYLSGADEGNFYYFFPQTHRVFVYRNIKVNPFSFKADSITIPESFFYYGFTGNWLNIYGYSGKMYVYDKNTLQQLFVMSGNYSPGALYKDSKENLWVSTIDKGLLMFKKKQLNKMALPQGFNNTNFLSIAYPPGSTLLAGNYSGQVLETGPKINIVHTIPANKWAFFRVRKLLFSHNKLFVISEQGIFIDYKMHLANTVGFGSGKTGINYNDSIIILGVSSGMRKINTITERSTSLFNMSKRVTALIKAANGLIYYGSTDGLYVYNYAKNTAWSLAAKNPLLSQRITGLSITPDSLLWVATAGNGVAVVKNDSVLLNITGADGIIDDVTRSIATGRQGQVWVGTWKGISVINYKLSGNKIRYTVQNISVNDGLTSNIINEMVYHNDTMYAATSDGISVIPADISISKFSIPVQLIRMSVNQQDTVIAKRYILGYNQRDIQMQFAGIELSGHFKNVQYTLDKKSNWINLDQNVLALQLTSGVHYVQVRAVDVNGNISDKILTVEFKIATPFWRAVWFWLSAGIAVQLITIYIVVMWLKKKRETKLAGEMAVVQTAALEQQAFTSLINPHFMFNALNSIQHYINVQDRQNANRYLSDFASLIRKNFEAAQRSFIRLEEELENIKIYLRLEQMRFSGRFTYSIQIDDNVDADSWMIPTMMMQPFLENALLHGIMPSAIKGEIIIAAKEQDKNLILTITDNGIGLANSRALKDNPAHHSLGMELIEKRISALNRVSAHGISIHFSSAYNDGNNPGTKIILVITEGLYSAWVQAQKQ